MTDEIGVRTLYVTGEESVQQVSLRAHRLGLNANGLRVLTETNIEEILKLASTEQPQVMVIDSIQTVYTDSLQSAPGAVAQVRESAAQLVRYAKQTGTAIFLVGHVTKEGALAGPRVLEHMVDTVLYFEGDSGSRFRVIRAVKNRFGAVNELGVFAMTDKGLREVSNPSAIFLSRHAKDVAGSVIMVTREGTRPLLVEVQALVDASHLSNPRRVTVGLESNRLAMLLAVFHRHGGVATYDQDVFVNVVGGVRISETGADLAILLAVLSSLRDRPLPRDLVVFGEVGLAGEIRPVQNGSQGPHLFREVSNPSAIFLSRHAKDVAGSVIMVTREGTRPLLVEVQALVDASHLSNPRRVTVGLESNRLAMLLAVFHRHGGVATYDQDVFVNVVGGVRISETGADLAILLAVLSSLRDRPLPRDLVVFGEVGLAGEIRPVQNGPERLREAAKHGFQRAIVPAANAPKKGISGIAITGLTRIQEALESLT